METLYGQQQEAISSFNSLLYTMCSANADTATGILDCLRRGEYDEALGFQISKSPDGRVGKKEYPWAKQS